MKKNIPSISDSELEVIKLIWKKNPITSDEIINSLSEKMNWNPQTIKTFITRLVKKKAISYNRLGRNYLYYPVITQKEYVKVENKSFLQKIYDGAVDRLVYNFIEQEDLSEEDIDKLQKMLDNKKKDSTKNK
ncbi:BlaI/MecI/CopY family transcriptional regulator [Vallitalea guaymasensis]|uniref:BlaI/MecI/CopY family transcriptional regulator n=1 Tax=Vallitalea guaymasensis TaxID=1185412 RepID=UPI002354CB58|nr:BlaI/MecI/CopY family transcriptional regulator [Vallitalea guaymasensis]